MCILFFCGSVCSVAFAQEIAIGIGELNSLLEIHSPHRDPQNTGEKLETYNYSFPLRDDLESTVLIPGFYDYKCSRCHKAEELAKSAEQRIHRVLKRLKKFFPEEVKSLSLKQYIIQPYGNQLLRPGQLAHATFETIRVFPSSIIIDSKVYGEATHLHELLHLSQPFLGAVNELEAYGLNLKANPQFLILNFPYFVDVVQAFWVSELDQILDDYFAQPYREQSKVPREVQWFIRKNHSPEIESLTKAIHKLEPLLKEVSRLYRSQPLEAAYWTRRTGIASLLLDIAAVKLLPVPTVDLNSEKLKQAKSLYFGQMEKDDNTRLAYRIDRKNEFMMHLRHGLKILNRKKRRVLYFNFLREMFIYPNGKVNLSIPESAQNDFQEYLKRKLKGVEKMSLNPNFSVLEKQAAEKFIQTIKKLPIHLDRE